MTDKSKPEAAVRGRWYFPLRALASVVDYGIYFGVLLAYVRFFGSETEDGYSVHGCGNLLLITSFWVAWLPLPEGVAGRTFGKWMFDLRVEGLDRQPVTFLQALTRHAFDMVDFSFFGLVGFVVARTNAGRQRVGDLVARTTVVENRATEPN